MFWIQTAGKGTFGNCWEAWARGRGSIRAVCEYEPVTARSIRDYIKNLLKKLGGKESTLERAVTLYNKALKDVAAKAQAEVEGRLRLPKVQQAAKQASGLQLGVSGNEADLEAMTIGEGGTLAPERGRRYSTAEEVKSITPAEVTAVQSIGRKNVRDLTSEERKSVESFARKAWGDMKEKSPFFEAWFGDWRVNDQSPVTAADVSEKKLFKAGKTLNPDTNRMISWGSALGSETKNHLRSGGIADQVLGNIQELIETAVLLDTKTSTPDSKSKMPGTAFMHSFYTLARRGNSVSLLKLFAEEAVSNMGTDFTRAYDLRDIKTIAMSTNGVLSLPGGLTDANIATIRTVADLFAAVKAHDQEFQPNQVSKIVNEDGTPKVVYHGTDQNFTVFDRTKGRSTMDIQGMFFSPWEIDAGGYGQNVGQYYLSIKNPASEAQAYKALNRFKGQNDAGAKAREYLISLGYDGVNNSDEEYIAFYPEQIKNAAENIRNGQDAGDTAQEFGLKSDEQELAQNYARWMDTQELLKSADNKIIETAAKKYAEIFDEFYSAINDFLVAHGYEPIGYIKGYAPHMRWERLGTAEKMKSLRVFFTIFK